jgi:hypothetical protein
MQQQLCVCVLDMQQQEVWLTSNKSEANAQTSRLSKMIAHHNAMITYHNQALGHHAAR